MNEWVELHNSTITLLNKLADDAAKRALDPTWPGDKGVARGQAFAYKHAAKMLVEDMINSGVEEDAQG